MTEQQAVDQLIMWVRDIVSGGTNLLVPISGGTDSALCFFICSQAAPEKTTAVYIGADLLHSEWFESIGKIQKLGLTVGKNMEGWQVEIERWAMFMNLAIQENRILVGSRNRTEQILGTYSMASRVAWMYPIIGLWKHDVLRLCEYIGVPQVIIASSSQADPACGRPEELAQIPHELVDAFAQNRIDRKPLKTNTLATDQEAYLEKIYSRNDFKHALPYKGPLIETA